MSADVFPHHPRGNSPGALGVCFGSDRSLSRERELGGMCTRYSFHDPSPDVAKLEITLSISERCLETEKGKKEKKFTEFVNFC